VDGYTSISIKKSKFEKLLELKNKLGAKSWSELVDKICDIISKYEEATIESRVKKTLCNHYSEASATITAWAKILQKHFTEAREILIALKHLKTNPNKPDELVVNREKCSEK